MSLNWNSPNDNLPDDKSFVYAITNDYPRRMTFHKSYDEVLNWGRTRIHHDNVFEDYNDPSLMNGYDAHFVDQAVYNDSNKIKGWAYVSDVLKYIMSNVDKFDIEKVNTEGILNFMDEIVKGLYK